MATVKKTAKKAVKVTAEKTPAENKRGVLAFAIGNNVRIPHRAYGSTEAEAVKALKQKQPIGGFAAEYGITVRYPDGESKRIDF